VTASTRVDPVTYQVIVSRMAGIVQEMQESIFRTGYSTIVRESHDASCLVLDADGNVVGEHVVAALHITALPGVVRAVRARPLRSALTATAVALGIAVSAGVCSRLFVRTGTRPLMVAGALFAAGGVYWLSRIPVRGSYASDLLPGLLIMSVGLGAVFVAVQTAANAGVPPDKAGLAASLVSASFQLGAALGLAAFSAIATSRTNHLLARHVALPDALTSGFHRALLASSVFLVAAAVIALRATNTKGEAMPEIEVDELTVDAEALPWAASEIVLDANN